MHYLTTNIPFKKVFIVHFSLCDLHELTHRRYEIYEHIHVKSPFLPAISDWVTPYPFLHIKE